MKKIFLLYLLFLTSISSKSQEYKDSTAFDKIEKFKNGRAIVYKNGYFGVLDTSGKIILLVIYDKIKKYRKNIYLISENSRLGFADVNGKILLKPEYDYIEKFGRKKFAKIMKNGRYGLIDRSFRVIVSAE